MKKIMIGLLTATTVSFTPLLTAGEITPALQAVVSASDIQADVPVIIKFVDRIKISEMRQEVEQELKRKYADPKERKAKRRKVKRMMMVDGMKKKSKRSLRQVRRFLRNHGEPRKLKPLWSINSVAALIPADLVDDLAALPGVESVTLDAIIQGPGPGTAPAAPVYWNLDATQAPNLWNIGHTGTGVVVASMDTGVDATHPDLGPKWRGGVNSWFDPYGQNSSPADSNGHGTQVLGLIVGGAAGGYQIGMAPDAQWIAAKIFDNANQATLSGIHDAYQWMLDPDGDINTDDSPDLVNNSWALNSTVNECNQEFTEDLAFLKEADIAVLFSAGNFGPNADTSVSPANDTAVVAVGGVDSSFNVDVMSSRGVGACDGGLYPHLVAPGDGVLTADRMPTFYNFVSGTSFAVAHLTGGMALLKGAFPEATVSQLESAILETASDLGVAGPDNTFGHGLLDVDGAYALLESMLGGSIPQPGSFSFSASSFSVDENVASLSVTVNRSGGSSGAVAVDYTTADVDALAGLDYLATAGTLQFADGEVSQTFNVTIIDDSVYEGDEAFDLSLSNAQGGATLGGVVNASATILDNEPTPAAGDLQFNASAYSSAENGGVVTVMVTRTGGNFGPVSINYATTDGSAQAGNDYLTASGTLNFADGELSRSFNVTILDDSVFEGNETINLNLSNVAGGAGLGAPADAVLTILDDDLAGPVDADSDGFAIDVDCNDGNASIYPGAPEVKHDGIDQDCNGVDLTIDITRAWYLQGKDKIVVLVNSDFGSQAGLSVEISLQGGGTVTKPLTWNAKKKRWQKTINSFASKFGVPTAVVVSGAEGAESASIVLRK